MSQTLCRMDVLPAFALPMISTRNWIFGIGRRSIGATVFGREREVLIDLIPYRDGSHDRVCLPSLFVHDLTTWSLELVPVCLFPLHLSHCLPTPRVHLRQSPHSTSDLRYRAFHPSHLSTFCSRGHATTPATHTASGELMNLPTR